MVNDSSLSPTSIRHCFHGNNGCVYWNGHKIEDQHEFRSYLEGPVQDYLSDRELRIEMLNGLEALANTGMSADTLRRLIESEQSPESWEVGEALAICLLESELGIIWPWNTTRDKRTPRANLQGADLVGFIGEDDNVSILIGEVKTSSDEDSPPGVMYGRSGMNFQLENTATHLDILWTILKWLYPRCNDEYLKTCYQTASGRFLQSGGREIHLCGLLMRDTEPNELDLRSRGNILSGSIPFISQVDLIAWYLPSAIDDWPDLLESGSNSDE